MRRSTSAVHHEVPNMREEIIEAATRRFAAFGYDGVSLQHIADDVAIRKPSLLYHFSSKDKLREAVLQGVLDHWTQVLPQLMSAALSGPRRLDALIHEAVSYFTVAPERARLLLREMLDNPNDLRARLSSQLGPWLTLLADYIRRGQKEGLIQRDLDPEAYVFHVVHLVLAAIAAADVTTALYAAKQSHTRAMSRHINELLRICRAALFQPQRKAEGSHG
jgi:TetR/AcrR family transcriptional regulator